MVLGYLPHAVAVRIIVASLERSARIAHEMDMFEGDEHVLGLRLGGALQKRLQNGNAARPLALAIFQEEAIKILVVPNLVGADSGGELGQDGLAIAICQRRIERRCAGFDDASGREFERALRLERLPSNRSAHILKKSFGKHRPNRGPARPPERSA